MTVLNKDKILEAAKDFVTQGKLDKAVREYEKILSVDSSDMRVRLRIAELFAKNRQVPQAIQAYRDVAEHYTHEGFYLKAVTVLKSILRLNPSMMEVNQSLAELYEKMGLGKDASNQYSILANAFEQRGDFSKSLVMRQKMVELFPEEPTYRIRLAEAYQREDRKEEAIEQLEVLARQYRKGNVEPKRLIELYEKILPSKSDNKEMLVHLVQLYFEKKDYKSALKWLEQKKQFVAEDVFLLSTQAKIYAALNQLDTARGKYQQLAALYLEKEEKEKALEAYEEILVLLPEEGETVKEEVEKIEAGIFEPMVKRAQEKRLKREKEEALKAEKKEEERRVEQEREAQKKVLRLAQDDRKKEAKKEPTKEAKKTTPSQPPQPEGIEAWLKKAKAALSLVKAYQSAGLAEESKQEMAHAKEAIDKILSMDPNHTEAKRLLKELETASKI